MRLYECDQKILVRFFNQGVKFIKDYSTNVTTAPRNAFVDAKGRIIAFFDQHRVNDDEIWTVMERSTVEPLLKHLAKYLYITDVRAEPDTACHIYWDLDDEAEPREGDILIPQRAGRMILTRTKMKADVTLAEMTRFRIRHEIPWQGVDFHQELILCVADEERISYLKGCYLGQEVVARVHYKSRPPKKLVTKLLRDCSQAQQKEMTSRVVDSQSGDFIGFVFDKTEGAV